MPHAVPKSIVFATDLSSRSDRALDRALDLAQSWDATLHIVHAVREETDFGITGRTWSAPRREPDEMREIAERQLRRDLGSAISDDRIRVHIERGLPGEVVCDLAVREQSGLIVTGIARNETLGRNILGGTVDFLVRKAPVPVLVVRNRVHGPYAEVLAATDFSAASIDALRTAHALFGASSTSLFHAYDIPFSGILTVNDPIRLEFRELAEKAATEFLRSQGLPEDFPRKLVQGSPAAEIAKYLEDHDALVVVGRRGASAIARILLGSTASRILDHSSADVLLVPSTGGASAKGEKEKR